MKIIIDADGCPVVDITQKIAKSRGLECIIYCDTSHIIQHEGIETVVVSQGADSADFAIVNRAVSSDIVITQDYGLAAMCLARKAKVVNQNGLIYNERNIDGLLEKRHLAKKIRNSGGRLKGPPKRTKENDESFELSLIKLIEEKNNGAD